MEEYQPLRVDKINNTSFFIRQNVGSFPIYTSRHECVFKFEIKQMLCGHVSFCSCLYIMQLHHLVVG